MLIKILMSPVSPQRLDALLEGFVRMCAVDLANNPQIPSLYSAGVRYRREKPDKWLGPSQVFAQHHGDCEDLCGWRVGEIRNAGARARAHAYRARPHMWHVVVLFPDGRVEDPSKILGMRSRYAK